MPEQDTLYNIAFFVGSVIAVVIAYFRKPPGGSSEPEKVSSVVAGVGVGFVSKDAEEKRERREERMAVAQESIAASLVVLADRERHEMQEAMEDLPDRIAKVMKDLGRLPG